ncbi:type VII secretion-associated protein [Corynebacterium choanae]|uniref:type VII secretion-associated protein n=1 Tax=Corynebacterium choanae TaxID=1862358 RepID=UPI0013DDAD95|nr:type VII secretion-associated protein [Corynebacterium choanae]
MIQLPNDQHHQRRVSVEITADRTVFRGRETLVRQDISALGICQGWAIPAAVEQLKEIVFDPCADDPVELAGDASACTAFAEALEEAGIAARYCSPGSPTADDAVVHLLHTDQRTGVAIEPNSVTDPATDRETDDATTSSYPRYLQESEVVGEKAPMNALLSTEIGDDRITTESFTEHNQRADQENGNAASGGLPDVTPLDDQSLDAIGDDSPIALLGEVGNQSANCDDNPQLPTAHQMLANETLLTSAVAAPTMTSPNPGDSAATITQFSAQQETPLLAPAPLHDEQAGLTEQFLHTQTPSRRRHRPQRLTPLRPAQHTNQSERHSRRAGGQSKASGRRRLRQHPNRISTPVLVFAGIAVVCSAAMLGIMLGVPSHSESDTTPQRSNTPQTSTSKRPTQPAVTTERTAPTQPTPSLPMLSPPSDPQGAPERHIRDAQVEFEIPDGFHADPQPDGSYVLRNEAADVRMIIAADPVVDGDQDPQIAITRALLADPMVELGATATLLRPQDKPVISYTERPGDGSAVIWATWVEGATRLSVGCHARQSLAPSQLELCRRVAAAVRPAPGAPPPPAE